MRTTKDLTAPCGIDCFNCQVYAGNITEETKAAMALRLQLKPEQVPCNGCRTQQGCRLHWNSCDTLDCVNAKGVDYCFECGEFPCDKLQPAADGADRFPHNMKVFNLCRIRSIGVERWAEEEAADIRRRYFQGKFVVGRGPVVE